jgi:hypothetical protein
MLTALVLLQTAHLPLSINKVPLAGLITIVTGCGCGHVRHPALYSAEQDSDWIEANILSLVLERR